MNAESENGPDNGDKRYEDFLLAEYNNIAQAHFNTVNSISSFFRYYLLLVALPVPLLALVLKPEHAGVVGKLVERAGIWIPTCGSAVGGIGLLVMCYIANLRFDALLYARQVNGIRSYFVNCSSRSFREQRAIHSLPRVTSEPRYVEWHYFFFVVLTFWVINTSYLFAGWFYYFYGGSLPRLGWLQFVPWFSVFASFLLHVGLYWALAEHRETGYFKNRIIGIDIDGVLNTHRQHFAKLLAELTDKKIDSEAITRIPVRECADLGVGEADEHAVFNHPSYWRDMPVAPGVSTAIRRLRNAFRYKIWIFSYRAWPEEKSFPQEKREDYVQLWDAMGSSWRNSSKAIELLTEEWLGKHDIEYDHLVIERGNVHTTDPALLVQNRFAISARKKIPIFVEDDLQKALKLTAICELVFLMEHPYNQLQAVEHTPRNLIPVKSWNEIYAFIRDNL